MSARSAALTMPHEAGPSRAGGPRRSAPNVARVRVPGGIAVALVADAQLAAGSGPVTIAGGVYSACDDGGVALDIDHHYYVTYVTAAAPTVLRSCRQETWASVAGATDVYGLFWHTEHYDLPFALLGAPAGPAAFLYFLWGQIAPGASSTVGRYGTPATPSLPYPYPAGLAVPASGDFGAFDAMLSAQRLACGQDGTTLTIANDGTLACCVPGTASPGSPVALPPLFAGQTNTRALAVCAFSLDAVHTTWLVLVEGVQTVPGSAFAKRRAVASLSSTAAAPTAATSWTLVTTYEDVSALTGIYQAPGNPALPGVPGLFTAPYLDGNGVITGSYLPPFTVVYADGSSRDIPAQVVNLPSPLPAPDADNKMSWNIYADTSGNLSLTSTPNAVRVTTVYLCKRTAKSFFINHHAGWAGLANAAYPLVPGGFGFLSVRYVPIGAPPPGTVTFSPSVTYPPSGDSGWYLGTIPAGGVANLPQYAGFVADDGGTILSAGPAQANDLSYLIAAFKVNGTSVSYTTYTLSGAADILNSPAAAGNSGDVFFSNVGAGGELTQRFAPSKVAIDGPFAQPFFPPSSGQYFPGVPAPANPAVHYVYGPGYADLPNYGPYGRTYIGISPSGAVLRVDHGGNWQVMGESVTSFRSIAPPFPVAGGSFAPARAGGSYPSPLTVNGIIYVNGAPDASFVFAGACCDETAVLAACGLYAIDAATGNLLQRNGDIGTPWTLKVAAAIPAGDLVLWMGLSSYFNLTEANPVPITVVHGPAGGTTLTVTTVTLPAGTVAHSAPIAFAPGAGVVGTDFSVAWGKV